MRRFKCKKCGTAYEVGPGDKRKTGQCFKCGQTFALPQSRLRLYGISSVVLVGLLAIVAVLYLR